MRGGQRTPRHVTCSTREMRINDLLGVRIQVDKHSQNELSRCDGVPLRTYRVTGRGRHWWPRDGGRRPATTIHRAARDPARGATSATEDLQAPVGRPSDGEDLQRSVGPSLPCVPTARCRAHHLQTTACTTTVHNSLQCILIQTLAPSLIQTLAPSVANNSNGP